MTKARSRSVCCVPVAKFGYGAIRVEEPCSGRLIGRPVGVTLDLLVALQPWHDHFEEIHLIRIGAAGLDVIDPDRLASRYSGIVVDDLLEPLGLEGAFPGRSLVDPMHSDEAYVASITILQE